MVTNIVSKLGKISPNIGKTFQKIVSHYKTHYSNKPLGGICDQSGIILHGKAETGHAEVDLQTHWSAELDYFKYNGKEFNATPTKKTPEYITNALKKTHLKDSNISKI